MYGHTHILKMVQGGGKVPVVYVYAHVFSILASDYTVPKDFCVNQISCSDFQQLIYGCDWGVGFLGMVIHKNAGIS